MCKQRPAYRSGRPANLDTYCFLYVGAAFSLDLAIIVGPCFSDPQKYNKACVTLEDAQCDWTGVERWSVYACGCRACCQPCVQSPDLLFGYSGIKVYLPVNKGACAWVGLCALKCVCVCHFEWVCECVCKAGIKRDICGCQLSTA